MFSELVREYYGDGLKFGIRVSYVYQDSPLGIAYAVGLYEEFVGNEEFILHNSSSGRIT
ncbi:MAG: hypothetical protein QXH10_09425 [Ignisphaera sp.]